MSIETKIIDYIEKKVKRGFASFESRCPVECNHCYTFMSGYKHDTSKKIEEIIISLNDKDYDIIYISGHCENFINEEKGVELAEKVYEHCKCDVLITTRMVLSDKMIDRLSALKNAMVTKGNDLFICSSIPAFESYRKLEPSELMPTPKDRIEFLRKLYNKDIFTFLTLRPLFPNYYIPVKEALTVISEAHDCSSVVLSSGAVVNEDIVKRLKGFELKRSLEKDLMKCLNAPIPVKYVDVCEELEIIEEGSRRFDLPFFHESLVAVKFLKLVSKEMQKIERYELFTRFMLALKGCLEMVDEFSSKTDNESQRDFWLGIKKLLSNK